MQEQLQSLLLRQNIKDLQKKGIIVTPANLSLAHYVGTGGVAAVQKAIENGDGDLSVRDAILKYTGKDVGAQNEELIRTKAKDFEKMQSTKLERKAREKGIELSAGYFQQEINLETLEPNRSVKSTVAEEESLNPENLQQPKQTGSEISRSSEEIQEQEDKDETIVVPTATTEQPPASNPIVQNTPANAPKSSTSADVLHLDYASYFAVA